MRAPLRKLLVASFESRMAEDWSTFHRVATRYAAQRLVYANEVERRLWLQIILVVDSNRDRFALCVGWNTDPDLANLFLDNIDIDDGFLHKPSHLYLDRLWRRPYRINQFWDLNPMPDVPLDQVLAIGEEIQNPKTTATRRIELMRIFSAPKVDPAELAPKLPPMVDEAMEQLRKYGIPFFERVLQAQGASLSSLRLSFSASSVAATSQEPRPAKRTRKRGSQH